MLLVAQLYREYFIELKPERALQESAR